MKINIKTVVAAICLTLSFSAFADAWDSISAAIDKKDTKLAVSLAKKIADKGDSNAQFFVGAMLLDGRNNLSANPTAGARYLKLTIDNPDVTNTAKGGAYWHLGGAYMIGNGVKQDEDIALEYLWSAAHFGNDMAIRQLNKMMCKNLGDECNAKLKQKIDRCTSVIGCD